MPSHRTLDAYCATCLRPRPHTIVDAGSCICTTCGTEQVMMVPMDA